MQILNLRVCIRITIAIGRYCGMNSNLGCSNTSATKCTSITLKTSALSSLGGVYNACFAVVVSFDTSP